MPRLLAADRIAVCTHGLEDIAVPDCRHLNASAKLCDRLVESDVRHHRCHNGFVRQPSRMDHLGGTGDEDVVAVDQLTFFIEAETAVGIPVMCDADVRTALEYRTAQRVQMCRATAVVDIHTIRQCMDHLHLCAETAEHFRHRLIGGTVRAVEHNLHPVEPLPAGAHHIVDILVEEIVSILHDPNVLARRARGIVIRLEATHEYFELIFHRIGQLVAVPAKKLDPIVRKWIVRSGDHNARLHAVFARKIRDRRGWNNARKDRNAARRANPRRQCRLEHLARDTRVTSDQNARAHLRLCTEVKRRRTSEMICQLCCQLRICLTAYAIRTKKSHHEQPPAYCIVLSL